MNNGHDLVINARGETRQQAGTPDDLRLMVNALSMQLQRWELAARMGFTHDFKRDTWKIFGYPSEINIKDYWAQYKRGGMARRIIDLYPQDTWKRGCVVIDGEDRSDEVAPESAFIAAWKRLAGELQIWRHFRAVDKLARIGRFAVILIGTMGGNVDFKQEIGRPKGIAYLNVYGEPRVQISDDKLNKDKQSPRFGQPEQYQIQMEEAGVAEEVHWTRIVHVAESRLENDLYGDPALEAVFNTLIDKAKITGGGAEAFWLLVHRGLAIIAEEGFSDDTTALQNFQDQVDAWKNNLDRVMRLTGSTKIQELGGDIADPTQAYEVCISEISATTGIPKRKLIGTEEGRLAGEQDERAWHDNVNARRTDYAEPVIVRPFIDWCLKYGVLPPPASGAYTLEWPAIEEKSDTDRADIAKTTAEAISEYAGNWRDPALVMPPEVFAERYLGYVAEASEGELLDEEDRELGDEES